MVTLYGFSNISSRKKQAFFATVVDVVELKDNNYAIGLDAQDAYGMHFGVLYILCTQGRVTGNMYYLLEPNGWYQCRDSVYNHVGTKELRGALMDYTVGITVDFSTNEPQIVGIFSALGLDDYGFEIDDGSFELIPKCPE